MKVTNIALSSKQVTLASARRTVMTQMVHTETWKRLFRQPLPLAHLSLPLPPLPLPTEPEL